jgi:DNA-binding beta-propeller fold protein YncE
MRVKSRAAACAVLSGAIVLVSVPIALAVGELAQKAGTAGCVSESGTGGACKDGRGLSGVAALAVSADGENAFAASSSGDGIAILNRNPSTGALSPIAGTSGCFSLSGDGGECQVGRELDAADDVAVSPDGKSVYVAAPFDDAIAVFSRSPATGELTQLAGANGCVNQAGSDGCTDGRALDGATSVVVSPDGENVYVGSAASGGIAIFNRNTSSGVLSQSAGAAGCINEDGSDGCTDGNEQTAGVQNVEVAADGKALYAVSQTRDAVTVYDRSLATGELSQKVGAAGCVNETGRSNASLPATAGGCGDGVALLGADSLALSADGKSVYVASKLSDAIAIFDRNTTTNVLTQKAGVAGCISETGRSNPGDSATAGACRDGVGLDEATSVAVFPGGGAVFAAARLSGALTVFTRNIFDGALNQKAGTAGCVSETGNGGACQDGIGLGTANQVSASADGKYVYAAAPGSSAVSVFDVGLGPNEEPPAEEPPTEEPPGEEPPADEPGAGGPAPSEGGQPPQGAAPASTQAASTSSTVTAPRVVKGKGPAAVVKTRKAKVTVSFRFSSDDQSATFRCGLDGAALKPCGSPASVTVKTGRHVFAVRAANAGGSSAPVSFSFTVKKQKPRR